MIYAMAFGRTGVNKQHAIRDRERESEGNRGPNTIHSRRIDRSRFMDLPMDESGGRQTLQGDGELALRV